VSSAIKTKIKTRHFQGDRKLTMRNKILNGNNSATKLWHWRNSRTRSK